MHMLIFMAVKAESSRRGGFIMRVAMCLAQQEMLLYMTNFTYTAYFTCPSCSPFFHFHALPTAELKEHMMTKAKRHYAY